jgi:hypothetical protein
MAGFDAVDEFDAGDHFRQLILPVEPPPGVLRGLDCGSAWGSGADLHRN